MMIWHRSFSQVYPARKAPSKGAIQIVVDPDEEGVAATFFGAG